MSQSVLVASGSIITRRIIRSLRTSEINSETEKRKRKVFDDIILKKLGESMFKPIKPTAPDHVPYFDGIDKDSDQLLDDNDPVMPDGTARKIHH